MSRTGNSCRGWYWTWTVVAMIVACGLSGCSGRARSSVKGQVTFDGQPIEEGNIRFNPQGEDLGGGASARITGGTYEIPASGGLLAGKYGVAISATRARTPEEQAAKGPVEEHEQADAEDPAPPKPEMRVQYLPEKYVMGSDLTVELTAGENTKDFSLTK